MWIESFRLSGDVISIRASEVVAVTDAPSVNGSRQPCAEVLLRTSAEVLLVSESREAIIEKLNQVYSAANNGKA